MRFFPYVGQMVGHPCLLRGDDRRDRRDARRAEELGVDGINLLAYRYDGDVDALVEAVVGAVSLPVIAAGSVDSGERIRALGRPRRMGVHGRHGGAGREVCSQGARSRRSCGYILDGAQWRRGA